MKVALHCKLRNGPLVEFRQALGLRAAEVCRKLGINQSVWASIESMNFTRLSLFQVKRVADAIGASIEDIVPPELMRKNLRLEQTVFADVEPSRILRVCRNDRNVLSSPEIVASTNEALRDALDSMTDRQREIVVRRFGIDGEPPESLREIGKRMKLTPERVRMIERAGIARAQDKCRKHAVTCGVN